MGFPTQERFRNLEQQVSNAPYSIDRGHSIEDTTFHGVIAELPLYSDTHMYLKVIPFGPLDPNQAGDLNFLPLGQDPSEHIPENSRYDKVYLLNLPSVAMQTYFQVGQVITYWHYSGQTDQTQIIRGTYVTLWVDHGQHLVKITSNANGSGTYNGRRMFLVGQTSGGVSAPGDLSLPLLQSDMPSQDDCIVINTLESGVANSHWLQTPCWAIGITVGTTASDPGFNYFPVIAVTIPNLPVTLQITDTYGSPGSGSAGSGFYKAVVTIGIPYDVNPNGSRLNLPDSDGMGGGESIGTGTVVFENVFENNITAGGGSPANSIHLLPTDGSTFVEGRLVGKTSGGTPVYRGYAVPQYWPQCDVTTDGGTNATLSMGGFTAATYTYTCKVPTTATVLLTGVSPKKARPGGVLTGPAQGGTLMINPAGHLLLVDTDEQLNIWTPCTIS